MAINDETNGSGAPRIDLSEAPSMLLSQPGGQPNQGVQETGAFSNPTTTNITEESTMSTSTIASTAEVIAATLPTGTIDEPSPEFIALMQAMKNPRTDWDGNGTVPLAELLARRQRSADVEQTVGEISKDLLHTPGRMASSVMRGAEHLYDSAVGMFS